MALSVQDIQTAYVAFFNRPADVAGLNYWLSYAGSSVDLLNTFAVQAEYAELFEGLSNEEAVNLVYQNLLGRDADAEGLAYWAAGLEAGTVSLGSLAVAVVNGAQNDDVAVIGNKVAAATVFTTSLDTAAEENAYATAADLSAVKSWLGAVSADASSLVAAEAAIDGVVGSLEPVEPQVPGSTVYLETTRDILTGTADNDKFVGYIVDNKNTFQSGDIINGGAGADQLHVEVGNSQAFAITAKTQSVEEVYIRTQTSEISDGSDNPIGNGTVGIGNQVQIDAQDMVGVKEWWSVDSRADLIIEDIRLGNSEFGQLVDPTAAGNSLPADVTFGMRSTDAAVDFGAYFDSQSLIAAPDARVNSQFTVNLMDLGTEDKPFDPEAPLGQLNIEGFKFTLNGAEYTLTSDAIYNAKTYAELETAVTAALTAAKGQHPELTGITVTRVANGFQTNAYTGASGAQSQVQGDSIVLTDARGGNFAGAGFVARQDGVTEFTLYGRQNVADPAVSSNLVETNVVLDNVGRGSQGGDLEIGGMSGSRGIEVFNVTVDRNSRLNEMSSTNNDLQEVNVVSTGANGNLSINVLNNVQDVNAASFLGNLGITGRIDNSVIARDLNLRDTQDNHVADNSNFDYTFGVGNDRLTLSVDSSVVEHEDFNLNINAGNGNNVVRTAVLEVGTANLAATGPVGTFNTWYANNEQRELDNLNVTTGSGADYVTIDGGGDFRIGTGAGQDTVYLHNGTYDGYANQAAWVFGAANAAIYDKANAADLLGAPVAGNVLYKSNMTVSFMGFEAKAAIPTLGNGLATQYHLNQAIKAAIQGDRVLRDLIDVQDGPANTLVLHSKIDGLVDNPTLTVSSAGTGTGSVYALADLPSAGPALQALAKALGLASTADAATVLTALNGVDKAAYTTAVNAGLQDSSLTGNDAAYLNDSIINAGAGNDLVVLALDADAALATGYNSSNTIQIGTAFEKLSVVNFTEGTGNDASAIDKLDFSAFLSSTHSSSGSAASTVRVATTLDSDGTFDAVTGTGADNRNIVSVVNFSTVADGTTGGLAATTQFGATLDLAQLTASLNADFDTTALTNFTSEHIFLIQNNANAGEYLVVSAETIKGATGATDTPLTNVAIVGTVDFGDTVDFTVGNFV